MGTKIRNSALTFRRKVSNTFGKIPDVGHKLLPLTETATTTLGYGPEVLGFESAHISLEKIPMQIKLKYDYLDIII